MAEEEGRPYRDLVLVVLASAVIGSISAGLAYAFLGSTDGALVLGIVVALVSFVFVALHDLDLEDWRTGTGQSGGDPDRSAKTSDETGPDRLSEDDSDSSAIGAEDDDGSSGIGAGDTTATPERSKRDSTPSTPRDLGTVAPETSGITPGRAFAAILMNLAAPGLGSIYAKKWVGLFQLLGYVSAVILTMTIIGALIGIPAAALIWLWAAATSGKIFDEGLESYRRRAPA